MDTIDSIIDKIKGMDFSGMARDIFDTISAAAKKLGRTVTRQLLCLYYVLKEGDLTSNQKAWIYASIAYVVIPGDLLPRRLFHLLGLTDDVMAVAYVIDKVKKHITPQIQQKVEMQLDKWFGYDITFDDLYQ